MVSLKDVAKLASVSLMTVSRAINNPERLKPETYQRVKEAINQLNYVPDFSARKIRGDRAAPPTIGVLALDTATTPFSVDMLLSIEKTALEFGWNTFVINLFDVDKADDAINQLLAQRPNGVIFTTMGLRKIRVPEKLMSKPLVLANCFSEDFAVASYIPDDFNGQYDATKKAIEYGYRRPLCLYLTADLPAGSARRQGFEQAWREAGYSLDSAAQYHIGGADSDYFHAIDLIERHCVENKPDFDLLICGNDRVAFLAYQILLAKGLKIPQDVAIIGYDNMVGVGELFWPPLTTIQLPHEEIGREAVRHIVEQRGDTECHRLASPLLERASLLNRRRD
jgi:DNA-binding LacI/PurR family transcriptional regulator